MHVARFPFFQHLPTVLVSLEARKGRSFLTRRLLVDSGFTGRSALVLSSGDAEMARRRFAPSSEVAGAIEGSRDRVWVKLAVPDIAFATSTIAISSDLAPLSLLPGIDGLCGLAFLNLFWRWGAERLANGEWVFFLEADAA